MSRALYAGKTCSFVSCFKGASLTFTQHPVRPSGDDSCVIEMRRLLGLALGHGNFISQKKESSLGPCILYELLDSHFCLIFKLQGFCKDSSFIFALRAAYRGRTHTHAHLLVLGIHTSVTNEYEIRNVYKLI